MTIKANGRSALILGLGLFVGFAVPSQAAADPDGAAASSKSAAAVPIALNKSAKHVAQHLKKYARRNSGKLALKTSAGKKAATTDAAADDGGSSSTIPTSEIPPAVANANAQLASTDTPTGSANAMSARANNMLQTATGNPADAQPAAATEVVSADQLNDVDRALQEGNATAANPAMASAEARAAESRNQSSTWDQTSLIGKIFIGFGALLTMASAARMFMA